MSRDGSFVKWASSSLVGHIVAAQIVFTLPISVMLLLSAHRQGLLTVSWACFVLLIGSICGACAGTLLWFTATRPLIKRIERGD